jgi:FkbM family methyltransferase
MKLIDLGAYNGDTALHFIAYPDIDSIDAYEPNSDFTEIWSAISQHYPTIRFFPSAVYTKTGFVPYRKMTDAGLGSTLISEKIDSDKGELMEVACVDIMGIIPNEPFCLKVDIEGAEYDVLERLIDSGKSDLVDRLYVEWHDAKMTSDNTTRQARIVEHFGKRIKEWL